MASIYELSPRSRACSADDAEARRRRRPRTPSRRSRRSCRSPPGPRSRDARRPGTLLLLPAVLFARMAMNAVDGMLAREHGQKSRLGALLNELGDVVSDAALYLPLALVPGSSPALVAVIVVRGRARRDAGVLGPAMGRAAATTGRWGRATAPSRSGWWHCCSHWAFPGAWLDAVPGSCCRAADRDRLEPLHSRVAGGRRVNEVLERIPRGPVLYVFAGVMGLLALSTILGALLARLQPDKDFRELNARVRSWWLMAVVFMLAILLSRAVSLVFMAFLSFLALKEYFSLIPTRRADRSVLLWAYLAVPLQYLWVWHRLVRDVHHLHPGLHVPVHPDAHGAARRDRGLPAGRRHDPLGPDDDGLRAQPHGLPARSSPEQGRRRRAPAWCCSWCS